MAAPAIQMHHGRNRSCFLSVLAELTNDACMVRRSYSSGRMQQPSHAQRLPIFVTHAPFLVERKAWMERQFATIAASDVTFIECFNGEDSENLTPHMRACLHPCFVEVELHAVGGARPKQAGLSHGTLSLAVKHRLAAFEILRRRLHAALVLEDDAALPFELWKMLAAVRLPRNAQLFYVGSYSHRTLVRISNAVHLPAHASVNG